MKVVSSGRGGCNSWKDALRDKGPQYVRQFSEVTTLHGVRYLAERNRSLLERVFWACAMASAGFFCWYFVRQVSAEWRTTPVVMSVETRVTSSWSIPSPAVTVCPTSHISHAKTKLAGLQLRSTNHNLSVEMKSRLDVIKDLCGEVGVGSDFLDDEAIKYVIKNCLPEIEKVFVSIVRMNQPYEPLADHIQMVMTPVSVCFTHNMLPLQALLRPEFLHVYEEYGMNGGAAHATAQWSPDHGYSTLNARTTPLRLWGNGLRTSTKYLMSIVDDDYDEECSFGTRALSVYLHNPAEMPSRVHSNVFIDMNYRVTVFITPTVTITDDSVKVWPPIKRGCFFETERYLRFFKIYNQRNCERECDTNNTLASCGCVLVAHPRNTTMPICGPKKYACAEKSHQDMIVREMRKNRMSPQCLCLPACNEVDFLAEPHWRPWRFSSNSIFATLPPRIKHNSTSIALMGVAVKRKYLNKTRRTALMGYAAYVASVGGILSLFLGVSFLSLFEIVYFITLRAVTNVWNMRKDEKRDMFWAQPTAQSSKNRPFIL